MANKGQKYVSELEQKHRRRVDEIHSSGNYKYKNPSRNHPNNNRNQWKTFHSNTHSHAFFLDSEEYGFEGQDYYNYNKQHYEGGRAKYQDNQYYNKNFKGSYQEGGDKWGKAHGGSFIKANYN